MTEEQKYWQQFDEAFFNDGYNIGKSFLSVNITQNKLFLAQQQLYKQIDLLIEAFLNRSNAEGKKADCKMGCSICCNQTVLISPHEAFFLANFVSRKFASEQLRTIIERAEAKANLTSKLTIDKLLKFKNPCPLLHPIEGFCRAYQARPMACRIYLSSSLKSCTDDYNSPNDDSIYPQLFEMPLRAGRMMNEGFQAFLRKGKEDSLEVFENSLEEGLLTAMKFNSYEKWVKGQKVFRKIK